MMWIIKNKKNKKAKSTPHMRIWWVGWRRGVFRKKKKSFTRMQIKPKFLQGRKSEMVYITEVKSTI